MDRIERLEDDLERAQQALRDIVHAVDEYERVTGVVGSALHKMREAAKGALGAG